MDAVEWAELAALPQLAHLQITDVDFTKAPTMASITHLGLATSRSDIRFDLVADRFPNLGQLRITALSDVACDLTPIRSLADMRLFFYNADRIHASGLEKFNPEQITLSPRPRPTQPHAMPQDAS
ncbi:hypothetical protein [Streptomyces sp. NBC_01483]|uniref:hypothetical protein n=1 Tax=Streptomyces sp. NBC_01483 TaxID=2903883 RepID=UPI002E374758|nr:hypothetical protein [Streptomyces sp. NBC_01483]